MDHPKEKLILYAFDLLEYQEKQKIEGHLITCKQCREKLEEVKQMYRFFQEILSKTNKDDEEFQKICNEVMNKSTSELKIPKLPEGLQNLIDQNIKQNVFGDFSAKIHSQIINLIKEKKIEIGAVIDLVKDLPNTKIMEVSFPSISLSKCIPSFLTATRSDDQVETTGVVTNIGSGDFSGEIVVRSKTITVNITAPQKTGQFVYLFAKDIVLHSQTDSLGRVVFNDVRGKFLLLIEK